VPYLAQVEAFPDGQALVTWCAKLGFERVVSKRRDRPYVSRPSRYWVKTKCADWKRDNRERFHMFEGNRRPAQSEVAEREPADELSKKAGRASSVCSSVWGSPGVSPGIARELQKHKATLELEIAGLVKSKKTQPAGPGGIEPTSRAVLGARIPSLSAHRNGDARRRKSVGRNIRS
jgi:hypothetical protein